jgi:hypothetical protein
LPSFSGNCSNKWISSFSSRSVDVFCFVFFNLFSFHYTWRPGVCVCLCRMGHAPVSLPSSPLVT